MLNILIYDAKPDLARLMVSLLSEYPFVEHVEISTLPAAGYLRTRDLDFDCIFWGINRLDGAEFEYFERLLEDRPHRLTIAMVSFKHVSMARCAAKAGAHGVMQKSIKPEEMKILFDMVMGEILERYPIRKKPRPKPKVTDRQMDIFWQLSLGYGFLEISERKKIKLETTRSHVKALYRSLESRGIDQLVAEGFRRKVLY